MENSGLNLTGLMHAVPASLKDKYVIRFTVTSPRTTVEDVERDWNIIQTIANDSTPKGKERVKLKGTVIHFHYGSTREECSQLILYADIKEQNRHFGTSLLLANIGPNTAMTPKFINSSHAALLENVQIEQDIQTKLKHTSSERTS